MMYTGDNTYLYGFDMESVESYSSNSCIIQQLRRVYRSTAMDIDTKDLRHNIINMDLRCVSIERSTIKGDMARSTVNKGT